jgi:hypothetical protein
MVIRSRVRRRGRTGGFPYAVRGLRLPGARPSPFLLAPAAVRNVAAQALADLRQQRRSAPTFRATPSASRVLSDPEFVITELATEAMTFTAAAHRRTPRDAHRSATRGPAERRPGSSNRRARPVGAARRLEGLQANTLALKATSVASRPRPRWTTLAPAHRAERGSRSRFSAAAEGAEQGLALLPLSSSRRLDYHRRDDRCGRPPGVRRARRLAPAFVGYCGRPRLPRRRVRRSSRASVSRLNSAPFASNWKGGVRRSCAA